MQKWLCLKEKGRGARGGDISGRKGEERREEEGKTRGKGGGDE